MNKVIKIFNRLVILILIMLFILFGSAITLIKKPDLGIRLYNNFFSENIFFQIIKKVNKHIIKIYFNACNKKIFT